MSGERISLCGEEAPLPACTQHEQWACFCRTASEILPPHDSAANIWLRSTKLTHQNADVCSLQPSVTASFFFFCRVIGFLQRRQLLGGVGVGVGGSSQVQTERNTRAQLPPPSVKQQQVSNRPRHRISASTRPPHPRRP